MENRLNKFNNLLIFGMKYALKRVHIFLWPMIFKCLPGPLIAPVSCCNHYVFTAFFSDFRNYLISLINKLLRKPASFLRLRAPANPQLAYVCGACFAGKNQTSKRGILRHYFFMPRKSTTGLRLRAALGLTPVLRLRASRCNISILLKNSVTLGPASPLSLRGFSMIKGGEAWTSSQR